MFRTLDDNASYAVSEISDMDASLSGPKIKSPLSNVRFHSLQSIPRDVNPQTIDISGVNRSGVSKLDLNMGQQQSSILDMYYDDCKTVHNLKPRPLVGEWSSAALGADVFAQPRRIGRRVQISKGLSNFSALNLGDSRLQRVSSSTREEYRSPDDRKAYGRPVMDPNFRNLKSAGHAGCGLFAKSYHMDDETRGDADSSVVGAASTAKLMTLLSPIKANNDSGNASLNSRSGRGGNGGGGFKKTATGSAFGNVSLGRETAADLSGRALRVSLYRTALQNLGAFDPKAAASTLGPWPTSKPSNGATKASAGASFSVQVLAELEIIFRNRLQFRTGKGVGKFHLQSMFSFLDRSGRGGFDLEDFRQSIEALGLVFSEEQTVALFAKYDRGCKGFISYHDFSLQLGFDAQDDVYLVQKLMTEYTFYAQRNQHLFQTWSADLSLGKSRVLARVLREEAANSNGGGFDDEVRNEDINDNDDANQTVASKNVVFEDWLQTVRNSQAMA